ncbi:hypothetical protein [Mycobacterium sp. SMC-17]|uniref:hypothetical protein n=1 Tax=Mycobacterium sp. SMC-17 TaxID=3381628 RepID=UPI00387613DA
MTAPKRRESADGVVARRDDPEVVVATLPGSYAPTVIDLREWPCDTKLRVQLADAIEALTGVNGTWKSAQSARQNRDRIKYFARWCGEHEVRELQQLTPDRWNSYLLHLATKGTKSNTQHRQLVAVRQLIRRYPHRLHPDLSRHLNRRLPKRDADESQPYSQDLYDAILKAAAAAVNAEFQRIHPNQLMLRRRNDTKLSPEHKARADALREVATTGAPLSDATRDALGITLSDHRYSGVNKARPMLFVSQEGAVAIAVLIACLEGANFTPINERKVPSAAPGLGVREEIWGVEDEKRRRHDHPYDAHAIPKNARRAMSKIIEMTQPGRDYLAANNLPGADRLIVYWPAMKALESSPSVGLTPSHLKLSRLTWWPNQDEPISFTRIRKTVRVLIDRTPQGHSRATWSTTYIEASEVERERLMTEAVETGLWAVIKNAENHLKMRYERALAMTNTDTTIGGCVDWEHHPLTGQPCGDDFLLCLQCANAFATPRHLPRLIELRHQLEAIASTDGPDWTDFRAMAYGCLVALIDDRTLITDGEYAAAERDITDEDRTEIHLLLNGKYT